MNLLIFLEEILLSLLNKFIFGLVLGLLLSLFLGGGVVWVFFFVLFLAGWFWFGFVFFNFCLSRFWLNNINNRML